MDENKSKRFRTNKIDGIGESSTSSSGWACDLKNQECVPAVSRERTTGGGGRRVWGSKETCQLDCNLLSEIATNQNILTKTLRYIDLLDVVRPRLANVSKNVTENILGTREMLRQTEHDIIVREFLDFLTSPLNVANDSLIKRIFLLNKEDLIFILEHIKWKDFGGGDSMIFFNLLKKLYEAASKAGLFKDISHIKSFFPYKHILSKFSREYEYSPISPMYLYLLLIYDPFIQLPMKYLIPTERQEDKNRVFSEVFDFILNKYKLLFEYPWQVYINILTSKIRHIESIMIQLKKILHLNVVTVESSSLSFMKRNFKSLLDQFVNNPKNEINNHLLLEILLNYYFDSLFANMMYDLPINIIRKLFLLIKIKQDRKMDNNDNNGNYYFYLKYLTEYLFPPATLINEIDSLTPISF